MSKHKADPFTAFDIRRRTAWAHANVLDPPDMRTLDEARDALRWAATVADRDAEIARLREKLLRAARLEVAVKRATEQCQRAIDSGAREAVLAIHVRDDLRAALRGEGDATE